MKALALLFLFCAAAHGADIVTTNVVGDITTRIRERTSTPASYMETSYRGKKVVMRLMSLPIGNGKTNLSRSYYAAGEWVFMEEDDDGDGIFECVSIVIPDTDDLEIFTREPDGLVKPASTEKIRIVKEQIATTSKTTDKLFFSKKKISVEEIDKLLKQNREKLEKLQEREIAATNASPDVTTRIEEHKDKDGNPDLRVESFYRSKNKILEVTSRRNIFGRMVVRSRNYSLDGKSIATELVSAGNGMFLSLIVHSPLGSDMEIFKRKGDGTVTPASTAEIDSVKKGSGFALEPLRKSIEHSEMSNADFGRSIEESPQKIQELNKTNRIR
jgi:hypothetical protein